ncbi:hypothetical protein HG530_003507 [Fusarium avenaceum]|nr:hypothetical protein HG530_003507 [Fusarium avenaceum]
MRVHGDGGLERTESKGSWCLVRSTALVRRLGVADESDQDGHGASEDIDKWVHNNQLNDTLDKVASCWAFENVPSHIDLQQSGKTLERVGERVAGSCHDESAENDKAARGDKYVGKCWIVNRVLQFEDCHFARSIFIACHARQQRGDICLIHRREG